MEKITIATAIDTALQDLHDIKDARLDAELLLANVLKVTRTYLRAWPERRISRADWDLYDGLIRRRVSGEPVAYILGQREFWSLPFRVTPSTLIPRPETEILVEQVLSQIDVQQPISLVDLGTGSGVIALSIAKERPNWQIYATDLDQDALDIAEQNARDLDIQNVCFKQGSWFAAVPNAQFDVVVSNPPYITCSDPHLQGGDLDFEPVKALVSGEDGLDDIRLIVQQAKGYLREGGRIFLEHGYDQGVKVRKILQASGYESILDRCDYAGIGRVVSAQRPCLCD